MRNCAASGPSSTGALGVIDVGPTLAIVTTWGGATSSGNARKPSALGVIVRSG